MLYYSMKKSYAIFLSLLLLTSHMYLTIGTHFCGGQAVNTQIVFGSTHLGCEMQGKKEPLDGREKGESDKIAFSSVPCCQYEYQIISSMHEFIYKACHIDIAVNIAVASLNSTETLDLTQKSTHHFFKKYDSPHIKKDVQVLFQTFLI
jgi:hypothetical protein